MRANRTSLWPLRITGVILVGLVVLGIWAYGPKAYGDGNNFVLAVPAGIAVLGIYFWAIRRAVGDGWSNARMWTEINVVVAGSVFVFVGVFLLTFESS